MNKNWIEFFAEKWFWPVLIIAAVVVFATPSEALRAPRTGMAAPPVSAQDPTGRFDPTWVRHRGLVVLALYLTENSQVPQETIDRVSDWQVTWGKRGFQAVVITESSSPPPGLNPDVLVAYDNEGKTRTRYHIVEDREYFLIDRFGRLRRERIRPSLVEKALDEFFDPSWAGMSTAWNQSYCVNRKSHLLYLADTIPETVKPGEKVDIRLVALPTFTEPRRGSVINSPVQVEVTSDGDFNDSIYRGELNEDITVSTELLQEVVVRADAEPGVHVLWVRVAHSHCGLGNCGNFEQKIPIPIWVD